MSKTTKQTAKNGTATNATSTANAVKQPAKKTDHASNSVISEAGKAIEATLEAGATVRNAEAKLVEYMFFQEVTFSLGWFQNTMKLTGTEKTDAIDGALSKISTVYNDTITLLKQLSDVKRANRSVEQIEQIEMLDAKVRNAREMFRRAMESMFFLRSRTDILDLEVTEKGSFVISSAKKDEAGKVVVKNGNVVERQEAPLSGRELRIKGGEKIRQAAGKPAKKGKGKKGKFNAAIQMVETFQNVSTMLNNMKDLDTLNEDANKAFEAMLLAALRKQFEHDGKVVAKEIAEWVNDTSKPASKS